MSGISGIGGVQGNIGVLGNGAFFGHGCGAAKGRLWNVQMPPNTSQNPIGRHV